MSGYNPFSYSISVRDYGAVGTGIEKDTAAIQAAIDDCSQKGGGVVFFPAGTYLSGTIILKNNVNLYFAAEAKLLGSKSLDDYPEMKGDGHTLIYAKDARNIKLSGEGSIDGQGSAFPCGAEGFNFEDETAAPSTQSYIRPRLLHIKDCQNVNFHGITLQHSASWCCSIEKCKEVHIDNVHLYNRANQNNDGFDLTYCEDVMISNCHIDCGDDAFALKEGGIRIVITNCIITTRWAAFRIGPEALGVYLDITVSNCVVYNTYGAAIKIQEVEGGIMENILFDNIIMQNVTGPISLRLGGYLGWKNERKESLPIGVLRNIRFSNIRAHVADNAYPLPHEVPPFPGEKKSCINVTGVPGYYVENITFSGVHVTYPGGGTEEEAQYEVPELRDHYPEYHMFGVLPAYGMYIRHAKGITLEDVRFDTERPDRRPALVCDDVIDLELENTRLQSYANVKAPIRLHNVKGAFIHGCRPLNKTEAFLLVEGAESDNIFLTSNDLHLAKNPTLLADEVNKQAVSVK